MSKYALALQILAWLFIAYIIFLIGKYIISLKKLSRLSNHSLNIENKKEKNIVLNIIFTLSRFLSHLVIFNGLART